MKRLVYTSVILALLLALAPFSTTAQEGPGGPAATRVFQAGADRLTALQNLDGGWDWPLDDGDPAAGSAPNTVGPIATGLAQAYAHTLDPEHLDALQDAGAFLLAKTNTFSPSDGYLAAQLDGILGGSTYVDHVLDKYYGPLSEGTYERNGILYDTEAYVLKIRYDRAVQGIPNLAAWDIGIGLVGATSCGADTEAWIDGVKAEIDELDGDAYYDVVGLAGAVYGLAFAGEDYDPQEGQHADAENIGDLADILASYQINLGGFAWNMNYVKTGSEAIQETAYAVLALNQVDSFAYRRSINGAVDYMIGAQLKTGGWQNYPGAGENNEITGEALWGISVGSPWPGHRTP